MDEQVESLIEEIRQTGDSEKFTQIIVKFQSPIYRYCFRLLGNQQDAEDLTQDVFIRAFQNLEQYRPAVSFSAWLYRIAYNQCSNKLKRKKIFDRIRSIMNWTTTTDSVEQYVENQLFSEPMARALSQLSLVERNLIILRILEERSFEEIREILSYTSTEAVKKKYQRTKNKLKVWLQEGEELENGAGATFQG
ncbi:RNA polymerase sigma factor [Ammoniphilus sp. CFH 90114]|uniref:RNA polymerase sigma factor n=1 Tax=Ammoniphilus sp. CFH 90114 TaxID=2493665 RepID=UPI0013E923F7|nr:RNA polymerase sigma factor [Ammoniphilus sp. CFH 90114]